MELKHATPTFEDATAPQVKSQSKCMYLSSSSMSLPVLRNSLASLVCRDFFPHFANSHHVRYVNIIRLKNLILKWAHVIHVIRAVKPESLKVWKSLKVGKSRIKSEKLDLIFYQTFGKKVPHLWRCPECWVRRVCSESQWLFPNKLEF